MEGKVADQWVHQMEGNQWVHQMEGRAVAEQKAQGSQAQLAYEMEETVPADGVWEQA